MKTIDKLSRLARFAEVLGEKYDIEFVLGNLACSDVERNIIVLDKSALENLSHFAGMGLAAHELSHLLYSKSPTKYEREVKTDTEDMTQAWLLFVNAIEDVRVENIFSKLYRGMGEKFISLYKESNERCPLTALIPVPMQILLEIVWRGKGLKKRGWAIKGRKKRKELETDFQKILKIIQPGFVGKNTKDVVSVAKEAWEIYKKWLTPSSIREMIGKMIADEFTLTDSRTVKILEKGDHSLKRRIYEEIKDAVREVDERRRLLDRELIDETLYKERFNEIRDYIPYLVNKLRRILKDRSFIRHEGSYRQGKLKTSRLYRLRTSRDLKLFARKSETEASKVITLVLDTSGSMAGEKEVEMQRAGVLLSEVMHKLKIPFSVIHYGVWLDSTLKVLKNFKENWRKVCVEVCSHLGAHAGNYDYGAVRLAYKKGLEYGKRHIIIVVSDGSPCCAPESAPTEAYGKESKLLKDMVEFLESEGILCIGVGIGYSGVYAVKEYYIHQVLCNDISQFPRIFANLLEKLIIAGRL